MCQKMYFCHKQMPIYLILYHKNLTNDQTNKFQCNIIKSETPSPRRNSIYITHLSRLNLPQNQNILGHYLFYYNEILTTTTTTYFLLKTKTKQEEMCRVNLNIWLAYGWELAWGGRAMDVYLTEEFMGVFRQKQESIYR